MKYRLRGDVVDVVDASDRKMTVGNVWTENWFAVTISDQTTLHMPDWAVRALFEPVPEESEGERELQQ